MTTVNSTYQQSLAPNSFNSSEMSLTSQQTAHSGYFEFIFRNASLVAVSDADLQFKYILNDEDKTALMKKASKTLCEGLW